MVGRHPWHVAEPERSAIKPVIAVRKRHSAQRTIAAEAPGVERAGERGAVAALFDTDRVTAMWAPVQQ